MLPRELLDVRAGAIVPAGGGRTVFVLPWLGRTLVGTTDNDYEGSVEHVPPADDDVAYLLEAVNGFFGTELGAADLTGAYAGVRPLISTGDPKKSVDISRKAELYETSSGLVTITGGKLTTWRRMAKLAVDRIVEREGREAPCRTDEIPLGRAGRRRRRCPRSTGWTTRAASTSPARYGHAAQLVLRLAEADPDARPQDQPRAAGHRRRGRLCGRARAGAHGGRRAAAAHPARAARRAPALRAGRGGPAGGGPGDGGRARLGRRPGGARGRGMARAGARGGPRPEVAVGAGARAPTRRSRRPRRRAPRPRRPRERERAPSRPRARPVPAGADGHRERHARLVLGLARGRRSSTSSSSAALGQLEDGAAIVDVGGESGRTDTEAVPVEEEIARVVPLVERARRAGARSFPWTPGAGRWRAPRSRPARR